MSTGSSIDQAWYNRFYGEPADPRLVLAPEIVERYRRLRQPRIFHLERVHQLAGDLRGRRCLYIGCGVEASAVLFAMKGAELWALDLAVEALRRQKQMALANGTEGRSHFVASPCERLPFRSGSFDVVIGIGILHHLQDDLDAPCSELARVLKTNGRAVFEEPIARSRMLQRIRSWLPVPPPRDASPRCRPLMPDALDVFARHFHVDAEFFLFLGRLNRLLLGGQPLELAPPWKRWMAQSLHYIDTLLLRIPGLDRLAGVVVLDLRLPQEAGK